MFPGMVNDRSSPTRRHSLLFYTIQGPGYCLEIHQEKISLVKKNWLPRITKDLHALTWEIDDLKNFEISAPKFLFFSGKITWETFSGEIGKFKFSTSPIMVKKIETYLQKRIMKNHQRRKSQPKSEIHSAVAA